ncbi:MAG: hypothetical protein CVU06_08145, partial [Bacteroidetes bacterium HGW-Bacteroidetes-22]
MEPISISTVAPGLIRIAGRTAPGAGNGYVVSQVAPGTRITRIRFTNAVPFPENSTPNMSFNS